MRVVIAEDQFLLRDGLTRLLSAYGHRVVAAVDDGDDLLSAIREHQPDIAVVDVRLPPGFTDEGLRAALAARAERAAFPVLVLSQYVEQLYARELLADGAGAVGYLLKDRVLNGAQFTDAVTRIADGGTVMDPEVIAQLLARNARPRDGSADQLSPREREAHEVQAMGARGIACLNSRDRNLLGFRRDLLTAAAYGVDRFLYVYGDKPGAGGRTSELTVQAMIEETRAAAEDPAFTGHAPFRAGVTCGLRPVPAWKATADFLFVQVSYSLESLLRWRESVRVTGPVYAGVMLASATMARNLAGTIPDIDIPQDLVAAVEHDRDAGVEAACQLVLAIRDSGAFDGVHLVPVGRYRQAAALLETELRPALESWEL